MTDADAGRVDGVRLLDEDVLAGVDGGLQIAGDGTPRRQAISTTSTSLAITFL